MLNKIVEASEILNRDGAEKAIQFAARLRCLGEYRDAIQRARSATLYPSFYKDLGEDPALIVSVGLKALQQLIDAQASSD